MVTATQRCTSVREQGHSNEKEGLSIWANILDFVFWANPEGAWGTQPMGPGRSPSPGKLRIAHLCAVSPSPGFPRVPRSPCPHLGVWFPYLPPWRPPSSLHLSLTPLIGHLRSHVVPLDLVHMGPQRKRPQNVPSGTREQEETQANQPLWGAHRTLHPALLGLSPSEKPQQKLA